MLALSAIGYLLPSMSALFAQSRRLAGSPGYCLEGRDDKWAFGAGSQLFLRTF